MLIYIILYELIEVSIQFYLHSGYLLLKERGVATLVSWLP